ncbi:MAG: hypothetical protein PUB08_04165 [Firmicutes bacterium]|nr:hypothetical protein [Bacillota bacterium]
MQLDKKDIDRLAQLDDDTLKAQLSDILSAVGVDKRKADRFLSDIPRLKAQATSLSQRDIDALCARLGNDKNGEEIIRSLKNSSGGHSNG